MLIEFPVKTGRKCEFVDITGEVAGKVAESGVKEGVCTVYVPHTTAGVTINENADPTVRRDILSALDLVVPESASYVHSEGNSPGHIKASLIGSSVSVVIDKGALVLGTWQGVFFCEFDGPRRRRVFVKISRG
jgi:secondary thiamine-phosphate synthase enzyme